MENDRSKQLFERAEKLIPGGVNSPVRAFKSVGGTPLFITAGKGPYIFDADGRRYIDYVASWGPLILGHAHDEVIQKITETAEKGTTFGAPTELELELAELVCEMIPSMELVRMVSSGTEAVMSAIRLARGFTKRDYIIKFNGCYHGHSDSMLVAAGSGVATFGIPGSPGIPEEIASKTLSIEFNDVELCKETIAKIGGDKIAAIIIEPVPANVGLILPQPEFLAGLRKLCDTHKILLIFDEVITGFRVSRGGAQERFKVRPDLTILGKILGGGLPAAAFGGKKEIMSILAPLGPVYQAGTLSGNPLAMAAGATTLKILKETDPYPELEEKASMFVQGMAEAAQNAGVELHCAHIGSIVGIFFTNQPVLNYLDVKQTNSDQYKRFFHGMLKEGIYLAPSPFEVGFLSTAHTKALLNETIAAATKVFKSL